MATGVSGRYEVGSSRRHGRARSSSHRELFNITGLLRQGYDDAHTPNIPLLVQGSQAVARSGTRGGTVRRELPGLGMTALDQGKTETSAYWQSLGDGAAAILAQQHPD